MSVLPSNITLHTTYLCLHPLDYVHMFSARHSEVLVALVVLPHLQYKPLLPIRCYLLPIFRDVNTRTAESHASYSSPRYSCLLLAASSYKTRLIKLLSVE